MADGLDHRQWLLAELCLLDDLTKGEELTEKGLTARRAWLRHPSIRADARRFGLGERRGQTLDSVCRRLAQLTGALTYYAAVGDLITTAPDDLAGLELDDEAGPR